MDTLLWAIGRADGIDIIGAMWRPFLISLLLYYSGYLAVWLATLARAARITPPFRGLTDAPDVLIVLPTLLKTAADAADLRDAATTVIGNGYPGKVVVCLAIDGSNDQPALVDELEAWASQQTTTILVARVPTRSGKGVAVAAGLHRAKAAVAAGQLVAVPPIFFNMDADGVLAPRAIERMVAKLVTPGTITRRRPMIVASNVMVRRAHYWNGVRDFFTVRYQLALQVAREYMTSISISRNNRGLLPVTGVSGALYATWTELHELQPHFAAFLQTIRARDVAAWWFGKAPPSFAAFTGEPNIRATAGPGDDTWMAWFASIAHWRDGRIEVALPRTPLHAFARLVRSFIVRPVAYDPLARVYTATPTTIKSLFKQRMRWNTSRPWLVRRFGMIPFLSWELGAWILLDLLLVLSIHAMIAIALLGWPFADRPAMWIAMLAIGYASSTLLRAAATLLAMLQDHDVWEHRHKLLALPLSGLYHLVFNIISTLTGFTHDIFLFGMNTNFAPEETLEASRASRVAIAYRLCRCTKLAIRAIRYGDVPLGWFWLGWNATAYTANGYAGWTNRARRIGRGGVLPSPLASHRSAAIVPR